MLKLHLPAEYSDIIHGARVTVETEHEKQILSLRKKMHSYTEILEERDSMNTTDRTEVIGWLSTAAW